MGMREMKDSGIEWIGEIPNSWTVRRGKTLFVNTKYIPGKLSSNYDRLSLTLKGVLPRKKDDSDGLQPKDFDTYQLLRENELVFKLIDLQNVSTSRVGLAHATGLVSPAYIVLHANEEILPAFAEKFYLMMWYREIFNSLGDNGVRSSLNVSDLLNIPVCYPKMEEQIFLTNYLDTKCSEIDATAEDIQKEISLLEEYKKSVITEAVTKGLNPHAEMKDSGVKWIGKIPINWQAVNPRWLFAQRKDRAKKGMEQYTASQKYGVISQKDYMNRIGGSIVTVQKDFDILKMVCEGDFVIHMRSFQGGLEYSEHTGSISSAYVMLIPQKNTGECRYFKWLFKSASYINALQSTSNLIRDGQAMRYSNFIQIIIPYPPLEEQQQIADFLDAKCSEIDAIIADKKRQRGILAEYKKSLIYEYVTGKKEVPVHE